MAWKAFHYVYHQHRQHILSTLKPIAANSSPSQYECFQNKGVRDKRSRKAIYYQFSADSSSHIFIHGHILIENRWN